MDDVTDNPAPESSPSDELDVAREHVENDALLNDPLDDEDLFDDDLLDDDLGENEGQVWTGPTQRCGHAGEHWLTHPLTVACRRPPAPVALAAIVAALPSGRGGIPSTGDGGRDLTFDYDAPFADEYIDDLPGQALAEERETIRIVAGEQIGSAVREAMAEGVLPAA